MREVPENEQAAIDAFLVAFAAGDVARIPELGANLVELWNSSGSADESGLLLPFDDKILDPETHDEGLSNMEQLVSPTRLDELENGEPWSEAEIAAAVTAGVEAYFSDNPEPYWTWLVRQAEGTDGTSVFVAQLLAGDYPCDSYFAGAADSVLAAVESIKPFGYISLEDFVERRGQEISRGADLISVETFERQREAILARGLEEDFQYMRVCAKCFRLNQSNRPGGLNQLCSCRRAARGAAWPGFDFNERARLCSCCGQDVLKSGSRWSPFFCRECQQRAIAVSLWEGRLIFPIGRRSLMHTWVPRTRMPSLAAHGGNSRRLAETVCVAMNGIVGGMRLLRSGTDAR